MIKVNYQVYSSLYHIRKVLVKLNIEKLLGFDVETRSIYTPKEITEAKELLKHPELVNPDDLIMVKQVAKSSGLSCPELIRTTHFVFGLSESESIVLVAYDMKTEMAIWNWVVKFKGKFLVHNTGFDLKICYWRTGKLPVDYEDTQLLTKTFRNNADNWKAKVGLKVLMESFYDPKWALFDNYNIPNLNDKNLLSYAAIDGAAVYLLWEQLNDQ